MPVGCLSNTNALHWDHHFARWPLLDGFDYRFLSFELGLLKPDRELFDRVAELLPYPAERILFLDDNTLNVDGATAAGFTAVHVRGVAEAEGRARRRRGARRLTPRGSTGGAELPVPLEGAGEAVFDRGPRLPAEVDRGPARVERRPQQLARLLGGEARRRRGTR